MLPNLCFETSPAIVVGTCGHGLSIIRSLHEGNVPIVALESDMTLPGASTQFAFVEFCDDINGPDLISALLDLSLRIRCPGKPVLFLTNDKMVRTLATHWETLSACYRLSWSHCRENIAALLDKSNLEAHCKKRGMSYPESRLLHSISEIEDVIEVVGTTAIIKPAKPLAGFKTLLPQQRADYERMIHQYEADLPFLVQRFIPGNDDSIYFCAFYLDHGRVVTSFDGHKLRSRPMGHTTIAEPLVQDDVYNEATRFFEGLDLSGPVSLELKRDKEGKLWVIEPTAGRTDFWVGLCTANNINLPLVEYLNQTDGEPSPRAQQDVSVWFNEERDLYGRVWLIFQKDNGLRGRCPHYLFMHSDDPNPRLQFIKRLLRNFPLSLAKFIQNRLRALLRE